MPKPFVMRIDRAAQGTILSIRLMGWASRWKQVILFAMISACRRGLAEQTHENTLVPLVMTDADLVDVSAPALAEKTDLRIEFQTPLVLRNDYMKNVGTGNVIDPEHIAAPFMQGLALRLAGLAEWHHLPSADTRPPMPDVRVKSARLRGARVDRGGARKRKAITGTLCLTNLTRAQRAMLSLATVTHAGADTVIGAGRLVIR